VTDLDYPPRESSSNGNRNQSSKNRILRSSIVDTMEGVHNVFQRHKVWKRDITLLCCVLRLRCQPAVPYVRIADTLLELLPCQVDRLAKRLGHFDTPWFLLEGGVKQWLIEYLRLSFEYAEHWNSELWTMTQDWSMDMVGNVLKITELDRQGYSVMEDSEVRLQIKWRMERDWRVGSTPLGKSMRFEAVRAAAIDPVGNQVSTASKSHSPRKSFANQMEEVRLIEDNMKQIAGISQSVHTGHIFQPKRRHWPTSGKSARKQRYNRGAYIVLEERKEL
jgi:hypothetical protein